MIKAVIFDYDGVIVDSFPTVHKVYQIMCGRIGKKCPSELAEFRKVYGRNSREFMRNLQFTPQEIMKADQIYVKEILKKDTPFFPGIKGIIEKLSEKYALFLITSSPQEDVELKLQKKGLAGLFIEIIGSTKNGPLKKVPEIEGLLLRHNLTNDEVMIIGDRINDYDDARKAGISKIILVEYGWGYDQTRIPNHIRKIKVEKPKDILKAIASIL